jgi:SSS family solute:Na+ symporter
MMGQLSFLDWVVCIAYLGIIFGLAIWSVRGQRDNEDYFLGGRRMNWWAVGVSMFATSFSSISFLGLPQRGAYQDFSFYLTILLIPLVITPLLCVFFVPLYVRLRVSSGYEYLRLRFSTIVQRLGSLLYCGYALGWMGAMLYAVALTLGSVLDLNPTQYLCLLLAGHVCTACQHTRRVGRTGGRRDVTASCRCTDRCPKVVVRSIHDRADLGGRQSGQLRLSATTGQGSGWHSLDTSDRERGVLRQRGAG